MSDKAKKRRDEEGNLRIIIIVQNVSRVHTKHNNVTRAPLKKGGRKSPEERRAARQTPRDTYLFIRVIRRAKKKHARAHESSNDIDEADLFFVVIGRTNEQKKVRQSTNTRRRRRRLSLRFRGVFLNELSSLRF